MEALAGPAWKEWLLSNPLNRLAAGLYLAVLAIYGYFAFTGIYPLASPWSNLPAVLAGLLLLVGLDYLEERLQAKKPARFVSIALQLARAGVIGVFGSMDGLGFISEPYLLLLLFLGFFWMSGRSFGLTGLVWLLYLLLRVHISLDSAANPAPATGQHDLVRDLTFLIVILLTLAFILSLAYQSRRERANRLRVEKLLAELEESHRQLQAYAVQATELAVMEERNRLARDIHDSLGHYLTVINVQLEKAVAFRDRDALEADRAVGNAKRLAGEALQDIRRSVGALRSSREPFALVPALTTLVNNLRGSHLSIELEIEGSEDGFSQSALMALYRAAQEGLTNIQKHARASQATVRLRFAAGEASLMIGDNGRGFDPALPLTGNGCDHYGLPGVRERLELIQGALKLESAPGQGTQLFISVPQSRPALNR